MTWTLAAAQTVPKRGDVETNREEHLRLIELAASEGAQVLVFPELSLLGYELDLADELAFSIDDTRLDPLRDAASLCSLTLLVGAPVRVEDRLHIGAFILSPERTLDLYTKHHLGAFSPEDHPQGPIPPAEHTLFTAGERNPLIALGPHLAAAAVCADWTHPSHPEKAAARGATSYLLGAFIIPRHLAVLSRCLGRYASKHGLAVVFSNFGGPSGGLNAAGRSTIWSPNGEPLARLADRGAGIAVATAGSVCWSGYAVALDTPVA